MKTYTVLFRWYQYGEVEVEAESAAEAVSIAREEDRPLKILDDTGEVQLARVTEPSPEFIDQVEPS